MKPKIYIRRFFMTAVICIDNNSGMMFNHRRQSRDARREEQEGPEREQLAFQGELHLSVSEQVMNAYTGGV